MLHSYVTDMAARVTPNTQIPSKSLSPVRDLLSVKDDRKVQKLDGNAYKLWGTGTRSRSSSTDTNSDTVYCKGGPGRDKCGELVRTQDLGVLCDKCEQWYHASCQDIPKAAYEALVRFEVLSWLCPECKKSIKQGEKRMYSLESKVEQLEHSVKAHTDMIIQSLKEQEVAVKTHTVLLERSVNELHSQKSSYAEIVKGSCTEAVKEVSTKMLAEPGPASAGSRVGGMHGIAQVFDDFVDKERRKNNLVVHNLPESVGDSQANRFSKDIKCFQEMAKEVFKINVSISRSFRVGRANGDRDRLLIVTLDTPGAKHDILRVAPDLRNTEKWANIYITPDLTHTERVAARKVREELAARRKAGELNLTIRKGKIVVKRDITVAAVPRAPQPRSAPPAARGVSEQDRDGGAAPAAEEVTQATSDRTRTGDLTGRPEARPAAVVQGDPSSQD